MFQVRPYEPKDREGFGHVRSRVYRGGDPVRAEETILRDDSTGYVVEAHGQIVGAATVLDMTCSRNGTMHRCAGVAAVAVLPEWRGSGAGSALMRGLIPLMREAGFEVSTLHPFRDTWYRRYGYVGVGMRLDIRCSSDRLPSLPPDLPVREIAVSELDRLAPVCLAFSQQYNGYNLRTADQWWRTVGGDTPMAIYVCGDPVEAYAVVRLKGDFWVDQEIREFQWSTDRGYRSMLAFFKTLAMNKSAVKWMEPGDSPYFAHYYDRGASVELLGPVMFRLLDADEGVADRTRAWLGDPTRVYCADFF